MKKCCVRTYSLCAVICVAVIATTLPFSSRAEDKMKPEEIIAKHLESIGAAETRASIQSRIAAGTVVATLRAPGTAKFSGRVVMASEGNRSMIGMGFEDAGRFQERFGFDGRNLNVSFARPGIRGYWGDFLLAHQNIVKDLATQTKVRATSAGQ